MCNLHRLARRFGWMGFGVRDVWPDTRSVIRQGQQLVRSHRDFTLPLVTPPIDDHVTLRG